MAKFRVQLTLKWGGWVTRCSEWHRPEVEIIEDVARRSDLLREGLSSSLLHPKIDLRLRADLDDLLDILRVSNEKLGLVGFSV